MTIVQYVWQQLRYVYIKYNVPKAEYFKLKQNLQSRPTSMTLWERKCNIAIVFVLTSLTVIQDFNQFSHSQGMDAMISFSFLPSSPTIFAITIWSSSIKFNEIFSDEPEGKHKLSQEGLCILEEGGHVPLDVKQAFLLPAWYDGNKFKR